MPEVGPRRLHLPPNVEKLEAQARQLAEYIDSQTDEHTGFALMLFEFGDNGHLSWISNAKREDMLKALKSQVARFEMGAEDTAGKES